MIEKLITIVFPVYGIFMSIVREDCFELLQYAICVSFLGYIFLLFIILELGISCFIILFLKIFIDYVAN